MTPPWADRIGVKTPLTFRELVEEVDAALVAEFGIDSDSISVLDEHKYPEGMMSVLSNFHTTLEEYLHEDIIARSAQLFPGFPLRSAPDLRNGTLKEIAFELQQLSDMLASRPDMRVAIGENEPLEHIQKRISRVIAGVMDAHFKPIERSQGLGPG
jgi:hypothetical protein